MSLGMPDPQRTSLQTLYFEARQRVFLQGIESYDEYIDLVEELLQQKLENGIFNKHEDLPQIQKDLEMMWPRMEFEIYLRRP